MIFGGSSLAREQHWDLYRACQARDIERAKVIIAEHSSPAAVQLVAALRSAKTGRRPPEVTAVLTSSCHAVRVGHVRRDAPLAQPRGSISNADDS